ncbi:PAS domain-containing protein [Hyalangium sp.]|uniref:PAS domain-containing protein n=1 Tax=Hyalangium sp. TaxID=2028555 RepID=UPI002D4BC175|nr:PAS domain-containing protein [Hyalangium sp.]HYH95067.1 PAS domain-containing protein [Hyalangium sp.]
MSSSALPTDVPSLAKAVRAISHEFSLPELQRTVLRVLQEHTGAPYAALLGFHEGRGWVIQSQSEGESRTLGELPNAVIHGARRTLEPVLLADAVTQAPYCDDAVVRARGLRSVLCFPLTHRGVQHGLLYLEHPHVPSAFEGTLLSVIELLAAQAAVALDNARVHHHLAEQSQAHEVSRREVSATRQHLQDFIDHSPAAIYVKDREGRYLMINGRFESSYGFPRARILGKKDQDLLSPEIARPLMENDERVLSGGTTLQFEEELPLPDGVHTFISAKFPLRSAMGTIEGLCGVSTDITDRKRAEAALQRANEELEQRVTERTEQLHAAQQELLDRARHAGMAEIANSILHNLGNALTGITVSSTVLRERIQGVPIASLGRATSLLLEHPPEALGAFLTQDERGRQLPEYLGKLHTRLEEERRFLLDECEALATKIDHATSVIATQQNYARARIRLSEKARLRELLEDAVRLCAVGDHFDKVFQREYGEEEPEFYDRHVIVQILVNFISNAKNAVRERPGNTQPRITLSVRQDAAHTAVAVSDNGVGFDASVKSRLFTHGFTTRAKGHGFGLHSSALSAQALGGRIEAHSEGLGLGARFELLLPRAGQETEPGA